MSNNENLNRIAYLNTLNKKPLDILMEIVELECFKHNLKFKNLEQVDIDAIISIIKKEYRIELDEHLLKRCIKSKFLIKDNLLVLKENDKELKDKLKDNIVEENKFLDKLKNLRGKFKLFAKNNFNIDLTKEEIKEIFNTYIYTVAHDQQLENKNDRYFILKKFLEHLCNSDLKSDIDDIELIENLGIANQIEDLILYNEEDPEFLKGCEIFIDTPILMRLLGYDGLELKKVYTNFINKIIQAGATLHIFEHTFEELWSILFNYKRCIAQNIMESPGINTYVRAIKETSQINLPLEKVLVKENIIKLNISFDDTDEEEINYNNNYLDFVFDENEFSSILKKELNLKEEFNHRLANDVKSINLINKKRILEKRTNPQNYKEGKYYLLSDNHAILNALNQYYNKNNIKIKRNELMYEITITFLLWQTCNDGKILSNALFRSRCLSLNVINDNFKDNLYKEARRLEILENKNIQNYFIAQPELEDKIYTDLILDNKQNNEDINIKKILKNEITEYNSKLEQEKQENIKLRETNINLEKREEEIIKNNEINLSNTKKQQEEANKQMLQILINNLSKQLGYKIKIFFMSLIKKNFNKQEYLKSVACKLLEI